MIRIGHSQLVFVHDLTEAFPIRARSSAGRSRTTTKPSRSARRRRRLRACWRRTSRPRSRTAAGRRGSSSRPRTRRTRRRSPKMGRAAAKLCRLAFELAKAPDTVTHGRPGAGRPVRGHPGRRRRRCCCCPGTSRASRSGADLEVVASRTTAERALPPRLATSWPRRCMREGEAVLARNVMGDSTLGSRDSKGEIHATSVICAPVRHGKRGAGPDPPLLDRRRPRARPGRPGIHAGRGRHRGRGLDESATAGRSWPRTSPRSATRTSSSASSWACRARSSAAAR